MEFVFGSGGVHEFFLGTTVCWQDIQNSSIIIRGPSGLCRYTRRVVNGNKHNVRACLHAGRVTLASESTLASGGRGIWRCLRGGGGSLARKNYAMPGDGLLAMPERVGVEIGMQTQTFTIFPSNETVIIGKIAQLKACILDSVNSLNVI